MPCLRIIGTVPSWLMRSNSVRAPGCRVNMRISSRPGVAAFMGLSFDRLARRRERGAGTGGRRGSAFVTGGRRDQLRFGGAGGPDRGGVPGGDRVRVGDEVDRL